MKKPLTLVCPPPRVRVVPGGGVARPRPVRVGGGPGTR